MLAAIATTATELLFTGELDGDFLALDGRDGAVLCRFNTAPPWSAGSSPTSA